MSAHTLQTKTAAGTAPARVAAPVTTSSTADVTTSRSRLLVVAGLIALAAVIASIAVAVVSGTPTAPARIAPTPAQTVAAGASAHCQRAAATFTHVLATSGKPQALVGTNLARYQSSYHAFTSACPTPVVEHMTTSVISPWLATASKSASSAHPGASG